MILHNPKRTAIKSFLLLLVLMASLLSCPVKASAATGQVKNLKASASRGSVTLRWSKVKGADGYFIYEVKESGSLKQIDRIDSSKARYKVTLLQSGTTYRFCVKAFTLKKSSVRRGKQSNTVTVKTKGVPLQAPVLSLSGLYSEKVSLSWTKVPGATSYRVYSKRKTGSYTLAGTFTATTAVIGDLINGKYYTFRVCASTGTGDKTALGLYSNTVTAKPSIKRVVLASTVKGVCYTATISGTVTSGDTTLGHGTPIIVLSQNDYTSKVQLASATGLSKPVYTVGNGHVNLNGLYTNDKHKYSDAVATAFVNTQGYESRTPYLVWVNFYTQYMYIFTGYKYHWKHLYSWKCSTGKFETKTKVGVGPIWAKAYTADFDANSFAYYASFFGQGDAIHSWVYLKGTNDAPWPDGRLGAPASHGCIRIAKSNALWVYENCRIGTTLVRY